MTLTDTALQLLSACRTDDSDALRLALADKLDEQDAPWVTCPKCDGPVPEIVRASGAEWSCSHCDGTGQVQDRSLAARAELIRVQVRKEYLNSVGIVRSTNEEDREFTAICDREAQLLRDNPHWLAKPCPECKGLSDDEDGEPGCAVCNCSHNLFRTPLLYGSKSIARPDRGLVRVTARPERLWEEVRRNDEGVIECIPHTWLVAIARDPFVVGVDVEGIEPWDFGGTDKRRGWWREGGPQAHNRGTLPAPIYDLIKPEMMLFGGKAFPTEADAMRALSCALLTWATKGAKT